MKLYIKAVLIALSIMFLSSSTALAGGLSSRFVEVKLKGLEIGNEYSVKNSGGKPLTIENTTEDITVDVAVEPEMPVDYNLVPGYEPIPELSWITIDKDYFKEVGPGETVETDIRVSIPNHAEYNGKKYQVYIYSHTAGQATFRMGLMGRLLLEIAE